ncbi:MAG: branched-chain amino acid ABC transporter permease [Dehalococcoidia bacterium]
MKTVREVSNRVATVGRQNLVLVIFAIVLLSVPLGASPYPLTVMVDIGLYSIVAMGLIMLMGLAGQISLGHAAFLGCGAYISGILTTKYSFGPWPAFFLAALITGAIAAFIGRFMFKLHGLILAGVTLALNLVFYYLVSSLINLTGGAMGMMNIPPLTLGPFTSQNLFFNYYLIWIIAILLLIFSLNLADSRPGRALRALNVHAGGSEDAAQVLGVDVTKYKVWVFVLSAVYASLAGSAYAHYTRIIEPGTFMVQLSAMLALMAIIGGRSSPWGAFLGAGLIVGLRQLLRESIPVLVGGLSGSYELIAYGIILVVALLFMPQGLISIVRKAGPKKGRY